MSTPGVSLFQGAESIKVNTSIERAEEEEALEDQRRRHEELGNLLENAFDDLEEDETTIDSMHNAHLIEHNNNNNMDNKQQNVDFAHEFHQLKMLLASRTNEMEHCKKLLQDEQRKRSELQKRLGISETERESAKLAEQNAHELLVESKEKCSNLENNIVKLRNEKKALETENNTLLGKLETAQTILGDVQRKYDMVERDLNKQLGRQEEMRRKQQEERHRAEIEMMQQQMDTMTDKLEKKQSEWESLNSRYHALQNSQQMMLVEKSTRISELTNALSEAQQKCEQLLSKGDYFEENVRLQQLVKQLQQQVGSMENTIATLNERLEYTTAELDVMDSFLLQHNAELSPRHSGANKIAAKGLVGSTPLNTAERMHKLKEELYRALSNVKSKREELRKLQDKLDQQTIELQTLRDEENKTLVQLNTHKEENIRLQNKLQLLEQELQEAQKLNQQKQVDLEELRQEHDSLKLSHEELRAQHKTAENLHMDLERHKFLLQDAQAECSRLKKLYVEISNGKQALQYELEKLQKSDSNKQLQELQEQLASLQRALQLAELKSSELSKLLEHEKQSHEQEVKQLRTRLDQLQQPQAQQNTCNKCLQHVSKITELEIEQLKLQSLQSENMQQIDDLKQQLQAAELNVGDLREKLKLSQQQELLISELKSKAQKFEQFIRRTSQSGSSPDKSGSSNGAVEKQHSSTNTSPSVNKAELRAIEIRLRTEIAQIFAQQQKQLQAQLQLAEQNLLIMTREQQHTQALLQQRQAEVMVLKQAILQEREKITEMLQEKHLECKNLLQKKDNELLDCRNALKAKEQKLQELITDLKERQEQIEAERQSMKAVMCQWETQRKSNDALESEWKEKLQTLKQEHEEAITAWQKKYNSAKRTAANYKRYAEDKEEHMLKEYERLKSEYNASLTKIEMRMKETLEQKNREFQSTLKTLEKKRDTGDNKENHACN